MGLKGFVSFLCRDSLTKLPLGIFDVGCLKGFVSFLCRKVISHILIAFDLNKALLTNGSAAQVFLFLISGVFHANLKGISSSKPPLLGFMLIFQCVNQLVYWWLTYNHMQKTVMCVDSCTLDSEIYWSFCLHSLPSMKLTAWNAPENGWLESMNFLLGPGLCSGANC